ncbi:MAG: hypothetical protein JXR76_12900 [Deltaproteobacteria bacterium]|nr:hypothetical protein [Deltaproteobacteria bacterium]
MVRPKTGAIIVGIWMLLTCGWCVAQNSAAKSDTQASSSKKAASNKTKKDGNSAKQNKKNKKGGQADDGDTPPPLPPPSANASSTEPEKGTYTVRLRDLEDRVNRLKEQIFRSKARLSLLAETVLEKKIAGAQASLSFRNEMGGSFRLYKASLLLDGGPIFQETDESGSLAKRQHIELFEGPVSPGDHTLEVVLQYRGHGYGIFSYLKGYTFKIKSNYTFTVDEGKSIKLQVIGFEKGGPTTPLEERPAVRYVEEFSEYDVLDGKSALEKSEK